MCPECGWTGPGERCPRHDRVRLPAERRAQLESAPLLGRVLDERYVLVDRIGGGGGGVVYAALQRPLDRVVAIKVLHSHLTATPAARSQFLQEAKALSRLKSRQTVAVYDFGVTRVAQLDSQPRRVQQVQTDIAYMVMEFVAGESLSARIARCGPLAPMDAANIVRDLARSLDEAHRRQIVHLDIKPRNIILGVDPERPGAEIARVIDFGIASVAGKGQSLEAELVVGTPHYMAPELCHPSRRGEISGRTDVYAVGVTLFEMLTGQRPYRGSEPLAILRQHVNDPLPQLPGADREPTIAALQSVVHAAMAKQPIARFPSVRRLAEALDAALGRASGQHREVATSGRIPAQMRNITALYRLEDEARAPAQSARPHAESSVPYVPERRSPTPARPAPPPAPSQLETIDTFVESAGHLADPRFGAQFDQPGVLDAQETAALNAIARRRARPAWLGPILVMILGLGAVAAWWFSQGQSGEPLSATHTPTPPQRVADSVASNPVAVPTVGAALASGEPTSTASTAAPKSVAPTSIAPTTTAKAGPTARQLSWRVQTAVRDDRCAQAKDRLAELAAHPDGASLARRLKAEVEMCETPKPVRGAPARAQIGSLDIKKGNAGLIKTAVKAQSGRLAQCATQHDLRVASRALLNLRLTVTDGRAGVRVRHSSTQNARFDACAQSAVRQSAVVGDALVDVPVLIKQR